MDFGIDGTEPHEEEGWIERLVRTGDAHVQMYERVGRCAATTRDPQVDRARARSTSATRLCRPHRLAMKPLTTGESMPSA